MPTTTTKKIGEVFRDDAKFRQFFEDWRREKDPGYEPEQEPFLVHAPFVVVERGDSPHLILESVSGTAVRCHDSYSYVGGGSYYGGRWYNRVEAPKVLVQFHRYCLDRHGSIEDPKSWPHIKESFRTRCPKHDTSSWARGWQVVLPGEEAKLEKHGLRGRDGSHDDSYTYAIVEMAQAEFLQFLEGLPCFCRS